jgi:hypothetical protein
MSKHSLGSKTFDGYAKAYDVTLNGVTYYNGRRAEGGSI